MEERWLKQVYFSLESKFQEGMKRSMPAILLLFPIISLSPGEMQKRVEMLQPAAKSDTIIKYDVVAQGPITIESRYEEELAAPGVIEGCIKAEKEGFDAVIVWCAGDPGVPAAREMVKIPVIGPGEAAMLYAYHLSRRYSMIVPYELQAYISEELAERAGLDRRLVSVRGIDMAVLEIRNRRDEAVKKIIETARKAMTADKAEAIVLGCLGMIGLAAAVREATGIPVVDPAFAALSLAESLIVQGLSHSKKTYPLPPKLSGKQ